MQFVAQQKFLKGKAWIFFFLESWLCKQTLISEKILYAQAAYTVGLILMAVALSFEVHHVLHEVSITSCKLHVCYLDHTCSSTCTWKVRLCWRRTFLTSKASAAAMRMWTGLYRLPSFWRSHITWLIELSLGCNRFKIEFFWILKMYWIRLWEEFESPSHGGKKWAIWHVPCQEICTSGGKFGIEREIYMQE